jgi:hypothetical protein
MLYVTPGAGDLGGGLLMLLRGDQGGLCRAGAGIAVSPL